jgi:hypothetical protein
MANNNNNIINIFMSSTKPRIPSLDRKPLAFTFGSSNNNIHRPPPVVQLRGWRQWRRYYYSNNNVNFSVVCRSISSSTRILFATVPETSESLEFSDLDYCNMHSNLPPKETLKFGKTFAPHMLQIHYNKEKGGWQSPIIVPFQDLKLNPASAALHYESMMMIHGLRSRLKMWSRRRRRRKRRRIEIIMSWARLKLAMIVATPMAQLFVMKIQPTIIIFGIFSNNIGDSAMMMSHAEIPIVTSMANKKPTLP